MARFSTHFRLDKSQDELDFVDIPLNADITLFLDPYAIEISPGDWFAHSSNLIRSFFQAVLDAIRAGKKSRALQLLSNLREPNAVHLGLSKGEPSGRGIGPKQANALYQALCNSKAVEQGILEHLEDCSLLIENIGPDKISDMTACILRGPLAEYTLDQCELHDVEVHECNPGGPIWNAERGRWEAQDLPLPVFRSTPLLLVPKRAVRKYIEISSPSFYEVCMVPYHQAEHLDAGDSLVTTLKSGERRVYARDVKERHPYSRAEVNAYIQKNPNELKAYKAKVAPHIGTPMADDLRNTGSRAAHAVIRDKEGRSVRGKELAASLAQIAPGNASAARYHDAIKGILSKLFYPDLTQPVKEQEIHEGRKRIDLMYDNTAREGIFLDIPQKLNVPCLKIAVECKNYSSDPANPELDQLLGRLSSKRGEVGILVCRSVANRDLWRARCRDAVNEGHGYVLTLEDKDLAELLIAESIEKTREALAKKFSELIH